MFTLVSSITLMRSMGTQLVIHTPFRRWCIWLGEDKNWFLCVAAETSETCYLSLSFVSFCFPPSIICCKALKLYMVTACHAEDGNFCGDNYRH